jgi:hypothetical protein
MPLQFRLWVKVSSWFGWKRQDHQEFCDLGDTFFLVMVFLLTGFYVAGFLAFAEGAGFFVALAFGTETEDRPCFFIRHANSVKNCPANDFVVEPIKRDPSMASLPPICASTS